LVAGGRFLVKVALVSPAWPPAAFANGIVTYVGLLRDGLEKIGVDTRIISSVVEGTGHGQDIIDVARRPSSFTFTEKLAYRVISRLTPRDLLRYTGARNIIRGFERLPPDFSPDIAEMDDTFGTADRVSRSIRMPLVLRLHGPWFLNGPALGATRDETFHHRVAVEGKAIARAKAVTSPSQDLLDSVRQEYEIELPHGVVIPNPGPVVDEGARWKLASCDPDLVLFVGRFDRHKGGDLIVDAFASIAANRPRLKLVFIGPDRGVKDGQGGSLGLQEYLLKQVPDLSVRSRIQHLGQMSATEIPKWRQKARVTVVASRFEVFGMVAVEALAFGCPLVAARAGALPEIVAHEENGFLFEKGNASDLAHWLTTMLDQSKLSAKLGEQAAFDAERRFGPDVIAREMKHYYEQVIANNGSLTRS
jgi:glycosyltransferase involved in cell wall biosynthesis